MASFTYKQLEALEKAIADGAKRVEYDGKIIVYQSLDDMLRARDIIRKELGLAGNTTRLKAKFSKGLE